MKQTIAAVLLGLLAGATACSGARGSGHGRESTAAALAPNAGRGGVASPWLDDPEPYYHGTAGNEAAPAVEEPASSSKEPDLGDGGGGDSGGDSDLGEDDSEPEIELEEGWGGDEDWDEEDPGDE